MKPIKKVALLHSFCSVGKASLTNMIPILSAMGIEACSIPTILLSTHTGGYGSPAIQRIEPEYICSCADHYKQNDVGFDLIFVGYLGSVGMVSAVQYFLECFPNTPVVLDPILGDHGSYYRNLGPEYMESFKQLVPYAEIILPNLTEACLLTDTDYSDAISKEALTNICKCLQDAGAKGVVITSVPAEFNKKGIMLSTKDTAKSFAFSKEQEEFHGSGDVFDSVFVGAYLQQKSLEECIRQAHTFVCKCIRESSKANYPEREGLLIEKKLSLLV